MADCELFGLNAGAHHSVNALFHTANAVLLFCLLFRLTGALVAQRVCRRAVRLASAARGIRRLDFRTQGCVEHVFRAADAAGLRALCAKSRGSRVESRGQMRRSALSVSLDFLLALALFFFALGLMSKPMLVTLPFVMLLLDYWPLQRVQLSTAAVEVAKTARLQPPAPGCWRNGRSFCSRRFRASSLFWRNATERRSMTLQQFPLHLAICQCADCLRTVSGENFWPVGSGRLLPAAQSSVLA